MTKLEKILKRQLYKKSLYEFVKAFWSTCDPQPFIDGWIVQYYCEVFQYMCKPWIGYNKPSMTLPVLKDNEKLIDITSYNGSKLNINVPPRHTKSKIFNVFGPVWSQLEYPLKVASVSHTEDLASEMNESRQKIINSEEFIELFINDVRLTTNSKTKLKTDKGGELYSINRNAFTGYGGDIIVNDDITNAEVARKNKEEMANAQSYYRNTMPSRINNLNKCIIFNIQQRLAPNDITGYILEDAELAKSYFFIVLPAIFEQTTYIVFPISGKILKVDKGSFLWPERFGNYESLRIDVGETVFQTQYMQKPSSSEKIVISQDMLIFKSKIECPSIDEADVIYSSHDFPVKDKETSDFLGSILAYKKDGILYITDCLEKRMGFEAEIKYVTSLNDIFPGIIQIIEDKANGSPIIQQLQDEISGLQAFQPGTNSKQQRLESASLYLRNVVIIKDEWNETTKTWELSPQLINLVKRLYTFPYVQHDDIVDAFSQLLLFVFMDKRYMVYGKSFGKHNLIKYEKIPSNLYKAIFFNKEGDNWRVCEIGIEYGEKSKLYLTREISFNKNAIDGVELLKKFSPKTTCFIDCSFLDSLEGVILNGISIERYPTYDFEKDVSNVNIGFANDLIYICQNCVITKSDIENFKFSKSKNEERTFSTKKDGMIACIRVAINYFGGIIN